MRKLLIPLVLLVCGGVAASASELVPWTGSDTFTTEEIFFPGFTANAFLGITSGGGLLVDKGVATTFNLDIFLDGSWVNIANFSTSGDNVPYSGGDVFPGPNSFTSGMVSGLRLSADPPAATGSNFFSVADPQSVFEFGTRAPTTSGVPEPSSMGLMGLGLVGLGWYSRRRTRRAL